MSSYSACCKTSQFTVSDLMSFDKLLEHRARLLHTMYEVIVLDNNINTKILAEYVIDLHLSQPVFEIENSSPTDISAFTVYTVLRDIEYLKRTSNTFPLNKNRMLKAVYCLDNAPSCVLALIKELQIPIERYEMEKAYAYEMNKKVIRNFSQIPFTLPCAPN